MKIVLFANTDWYLYNFRLSLASELQRSGHEVLLISPPGEYGPLLVSRGFRWIAAPMNRRSVNPIREAILLAWLARLLRQERPAIVHSFTIKCAVYGSLAAKLAGVGGRVNAVAGLGYVFTSKDLTARLLKPVVTKLMQIAFSGERSPLILQNPDDVGLFAASGIVDPAQIRLIPGSGVNCRRFVPGRAGAASGKTEFRALLAARLLWDKGIREYVEASRILKARGRSVRFLLAGDPDPGNPSSVTAAEVSDWVREGLVEWLGHVEDMPTLLGTVDAVVLPSYREGLPKGLIEAAACGIPLVTTDVPGCRHVVDHNENGILIPVGNPLAIADAVERLQDDPMLCKRLGEAARKRAITEFDESSIVRRTIDVYHEFAEHTV